MKKFLLFVSLAVAASTHAQFIPGNLAVLKVGNGTTALDSSATNVSIVQVSPSGVRVDSILIPSSGTNKLVLAGNSYLSGALRLSTNGQFLTFGGYDALSGVSYASMVDNTSKVIARIGISGTVDLSTKIAQSGTGVRIGSVVSDDGTRFWFNLSNSNGTTTYPIGYAPLGSTNAPVAVSDAKGNWRSVNIFGGQLYANVSNQLYAIGNTIADVTNPVTPLTSSLLFSNNSSPSPVFAGYGYVLFDLSTTEPGYDVCYILSQGGNTTRGLVKSVKIGGVWATGGTLLNVDVRGIAGAPASNPGGLIDVVGTIVGGRPVLYATRGQGSNNSILSITDSAGYSYNTTTLVPTISPSYTTVATAGANNSFIGISFTPGTASYLVLPLQLLSFNASLVNDDVVLQWATNKEINITTYTVEHSTDGATFNAIGSVKAQGNAEENKYQFTHALGTFPMAWYRLKITDIDGRSTYSKTVAINGKTNILKVAAFPNPFVNSITITHPKANPNDVIEVVTLDGKIVATIKVAQAATQTSFATNTWVKGQYVIRYLGATGVSSILVSNTSK